ncbi:hypothetical protein Calla_0701 [Caldicellulosiruptor acetigenus 6A]|uniref:Uncharacterized protein n=2 Tax=Caldicellulosiruptor acetigenus TaxID=301953 RepID=G2PTG2_9FIRM|nr:hypothetical protein [Caldicellulosiruptor acetigenus]AEM73353.1 hypothetical protein Calla_0701 [Caldicellulosiruptor acetigenus 6A]
MGFYYQMEGVKNLVKDYLIFCGFEIGMLILSTFYLKKYNLLLKENFRGKKIPCCMGIVLSLSWVIYLLQIFFRTSNAKWLVVAISMWCISFIGLLDDIFGDNKSKGFKGHVIRFIKNGEFSTGLLKMVSVPAVIFISSMILHKEVAQSVFHAILGSLCVNLFNLFDLRPGRCIKVLWIFVVVLSFFVHLDSTAVVLLTLTIPFFVGDLREFYMLGDAGSNAIGYLFFLILTNSYSKAYNSYLIWTVFVVVFGLNVLSEHLSFSKVIEKNTLLNFMDMLGRKN